MTNRHHAKRAEVDAKVDEYREVLIDDFAILAKMLIDREYDKAAVYMRHMAAAFSILSESLASEFLIRKLEDSGIDNPDNL